MAQGLWQDGVYREVRSATEHAEFRLMLSSIADLYLTSRVLILMDNTYMTRFWTTMEAWCSMMKATANGVRTARDDEARYTIECIHNADAEFMVPYLKKKLGGLTPEQVVSFLASTDVAVTNMKDKETLLPIVRRTNEHVRDVLSRV